MSKTVSKVDEKLTTVVGDNFSEPVDITLVNGISFQYEGPATQTGNVTIQKSNKKTGPWVDTTLTAALSGASAIVESGPTLIMCGFVRLKIAAATVGGDAKITHLGKES